MEFVQIEINKDRIKSLSKKKLYDVETNYRREGDIIYFDHYLVLSPLPEAYLGIYLHDKLNWKTWISRKDFKGKVGYNFRINRVAVPRKAINFDFDASLELGKMHELEKLAKDGIPLDYHYGKEKYHQKLVPVLKGLYVIVPDADYELGLGKHDFSYYAYADWNTAKNIMWKISDYQTHKLMNDFQKKVDYNKEQLMNKIKKQHKDDE